jgi:dTDP-glucose 4,6-dehydratase
MREPRNILVTGGCGFVGSAFIRHLFARQGFGGRVVNLDLLTYAGNPDNLVGLVDEERYLFVRGDICDEKLVCELCDKHAIDAIVNFAAESHVDRSIHGPGVFVQTNLVGTYHLLEAVRARPSVHFHHVSTDEVYGSLGETGHFQEKSPYRPSSPYAASKAGSDHLVRAYAHTYGISTTLTNCSNNYGAFQFPEKLIPLMILNAAERKPLPVYGEGRNVRDWLHVDDHADALWLVLRQGRSGGTYNIGSSNEWANLDLVNRIVELVAELQEADAAELRGLITPVADRPGHDLRYAIDWSHLRDELGWKPRTDFDAGLRETVRWYLTHPAWIARVKTGAYREWIEKNYGDRRSP